MMIQAEKNLAVQMTLCGPETDRHKNKFTTAGRGFAEAFAVLVVIKSVADLPFSLLLIFITHKDATLTSEKSN